MSDCGIFGIYGHKEASNITYLGLYMLQHRGQESAGIVSTDGEHLYRHIGMGRVLNVFEKKHLERLKGEIAIGHNRYSTTGVSSLRNAQPIVGETKFGDIAIAHNGNLVNYEDLKEELKQKGAIFHSTSDSEIILHLMGYSTKDNFLEALMESLKRVKGAYSLVLLTKDRLYAIRDPMGFRPLVMGKLEDSYCFSSETTSFDLIGAKYIREVEPGEIVEISKDGLKTYRFEEKNKKAFCIFEYIYFSRPDSIVFGDSVFKIRYEFGKMLAKEHPVKGDLVVPVPDSSIVSALGYSEESKIPYMHAMIRSHYVGRTFIEPEQKIRDFGAKIKYNVVEHLVKGKRVIVVDDSIMRGTTAKKIIKMFRNKGAKEIHLRISSPPTRFPCYYGIDIPSKKELIASDIENISEIAKQLGVDSLGYLSIEGMLKVVENRKQDFCIACFSGDYPIKPKTIYQERPERIKEDV